ncbi:hypothetical protein B0T13DRAFT_314138 [Neurospora crassa]|nr:hypothetical protein B0T13DRAFT_314138 [Neurospora crassa]
MRVKASIEATVRIINLVLTCYHRYLLLPYLEVSQIVIPMPCTVSPASISYSIIGKVPSKLEEHGAKVVKQAKREYWKTKQPIVLRQRHVDRLDTPEPHVRKEVWLGKRKMTRLLLQIFGNFLLLPSTIKNTTAKEVTMHDDASLKSGLLPRLQQQGNTPARRPQATTPSNFLSRSRNHAHDIDASPTRPWYKSPQREVGPFLSFVFPRICSPVTTLMRSNFKRMHVGVRCAGASQSR